MSWKLNFVTNPQTKMLHKWEPGTCWFARWYFDPEKDQKRLEDLIRLSAENKKHLSLNYLQKWATVRPPYVIVLPNKVAWSPDSHPISDGKYISGGWDVEGDISNLTVSPSIHMTDYHGWIRNGEITDDVDGRTFPH